MDDHKEGNFYKGLFYGMVFGLGLVWFLGTKEGQKIKDQLLTRGKDFIEKSGETIESSFEENLDK